MTDTHIHIAIELMDIQTEMTRLQIWSSDRPSAEALASTEPFCIDTLTFAQWIQFIFIERMQQIIEQRAPLPDQCNIAPLAEEYFKQEKLDASLLINKIKRIDDLISGKAAAQVTSKHFDS